MLNDAAINLEFDTIEELEQGAGTLYGITSQLAKGGDLSKTLDMKGREAALTLVSVCANMFAEYFSHLYDLEDECRISEDDSL